jgi:predicted dehydrogenase
MTMRVGVVGCGQHATAIVLPTLGLAGFDVAAICARRLSSAQAVAARFGVPAACDSVATMIRQADLEAVIACVPPQAYATVIGECVAAGLPVLAEKPGAADAAQASELARLSAAAGVPVMVGYMKRFAPAYRQARRWLADPAFGTPSLATFTFVMGDFETGFGGYLVDNPVHHLDLARYLLGELHIVQAVRGRSEGGRHVLVIVARTDAGTVVTLNLGSTGSWYQHNESVEVFGSGSSVLVDNVDTCILRPPEGPEQRWRPNYTIPLEQNLTPTIMGFQPELIHFRDVVHGLTECSSDMASAAETLALVAEIQKRLGLS